MKKFFLFFIALFIVVSLNGCKKDEGKFDKPDGKYFAVGDSFDHGYKYWVVVTIKDKKITDVEWNAYNIDGGASKCEGDDKIACAKAGNYGMVEFGGAKANWGKQSEDATKWIVDNQDISVEFDDEGVADAVSSVTIGTDGLFELVNDALDGDAVPAGDYDRDGYYYLETEASSKTIKYVEAYLDTNNDPVYIMDGTEKEVKTETFDSYTFGVFVIVNGTIVIADFNATQNVFEYVLDDQDKFLTVDITPDVADDDPVNTILMVDDGEGNYEPKQAFITKDAAGDWYGMSNAGKVEWSDQVKAAEDKLLADQTLTFPEAGGIDGVSSVSIHVNAFEALLTQLDTQAND